MTEKIVSLRRHLALVFHRFLESKKFKIYINENEILFFNPFNPKNDATQQLLKEEIIINKEKITIQPFILPHHSKVSQEEYNKYATDEGYIKTQGFYLYRANRLLVHGTWFGLHNVSDAHKLIRIQIDIPNNSDVEWGIDVKKSIAKPAEYIKENLKRTISQVSILGSRLYTGRGKKIEDKTTDRFWYLVPEPDSNIMSFKLNLENSLYKSFNNFLGEEEKKLLKIYLSQIQEYLPLESILAQLQQNPHKIQQKKEYSDLKKEDLRKKLKELGMTDEYINKMETFK